MSQQPDRTSAGAHPRSGAGKDVRPPSRQKHQITGYFSREEVSALRRLAAARDTTVRCLMARAFNLLLADDRARHPGESDPTMGYEFDETPSLRGGAAHRRFAPTVVPGGERR